MHMHVDHVQNKANHLHVALPETKFILCINTDQ